MTTANQDMGKNCSRGDSDMVLMIMLPPLRLISCTFDGQTGRSAVGNGNPACSLGADDSHQLTIVEGADDQ
jgi:hypothetical protein